MKKRQFGFGKILLPLLIFFGVGQSSLYSFTATEVKEDKTHPLEKVSSLHSVPGALRENAYEEYPDLSKSPFSGVDPGAVFSLRNYKISKKTVCPLYYSRDLRAAISIHLFPTHFFL